MSVDGHFHIYREKEQSPLTVWMGGTGGTKRNKTGATSQVLHELTYPKSAECWLLEGVREGEMGIF